MPTQLAAAQAERAGLIVSRSAALRNSVVNRARDIICGVVGQLPFDRQRRSGSSLGAGWLDSPDPTRTRAGFVADVTDDLFFRGFAYCRITARDFDGYPLALEWLPWEHCWPIRWNGSGRTGQVELLGYTDALGRQFQLERRHLVIFESPILGVLPSGKGVLSTATRLDASADRFAGAELAAGWLKQTKGEPVTQDKASELVDQWIGLRAEKAIGFLNEVLDYEEGDLDPDRLQLVESRSYQDAQVARVVNLPAFTVGVSLPGEGLTYKTALTARYDTIDFGLQPYISCWEQTLSRCCPRGTSVVMDLEPFLRSDALARLGAAGGDTSRRSEERQPA